MYRFISAVLFSLTANVGTGQSSADLAFVNSLMDHHETGPIDQKAVNPDLNEIDRLSFGLFRIYQRYISSQDAQHCSFHPSCSAYGLQCVRKHGLIKGGIKTLDRLTRCNGLSPYKYTFDAKHKRLYDPVH